MEKNLIVNKYDIMAIGNTIGSENGNAVFYCDGATAAIEGIFLRNILRCFGEEYQIIDESDFEYEDGEVEIEYKTNLPCREIKKLY